MTKAYLQFSMPNQSVKCGLCPHACIIKKGHTGLCGVRKNIGGILYAMNDGLTVARAVDPIEKKPLVHYLPKTKTYSFAAEGCNLSCPWCQNHMIAHHVKQTKTVRGTAISPQEHITAALDHRCASVAYTYGEPTVFIEYAYETMVLARQNHLKNLWISNGMISDAALDLIIPLIDAANIDLKASSNEAYKRHVNGSFDAVKHTIKRLYEAHIHVEITTLIVPGVNDTEKDFLMMAETIKDILADDAIWHISRFHPAYMMKDIALTETRLLDQAKAIGEHVGIKQIHFGNL